MSQTLWDCVLPLRPEHHLSYNAATQLAEMLRAGSLPRAEGEARIPVLLGYEPPRSELSHGRPSGDRCGWIFSAENDIDSPPDDGRVKVRLLLDDGELGRTALEQLRSQTAGVGLDAAVTHTRMPDASGHIQINGFGRINALAVVPLTGTTRARSATEELQLPRRDGRTA